METRRMEIKFLDPHDEKGIVLAISLILIALGIPWALALGSIIGRVLAIIGVGGVIVVLFILSIQVCCI